MTNQIVPFQFENNQIRVVNDAAGEPLFVAKDVAEALEYTWNGTSRIDHVPTEWRGVTSVVTPSGIQQMAVLTEQGLYFFLGRSDKPKALPFQKWLAGEVVPSIRKTGAYRVLPAHQHAASLVESFVHAAKAFGFEGNQAVLSANRAITHFTGINLLDAMGQTHLVAATNEPLLTPTDLAIRLGIGTRAANPLLIDCGLQIQRRDHKNTIYYELTDLGEQYGVYLDTGKPRSDGTPIRQLKWRSGVLAVLEARLQVETSEVQGVI